MSEGRAHPTRPGEPTAATARVRHRRTRREGRIAAVPVSNGDVPVLFDGDAQPRNVQPRELEYLDAAVQPQGRA